MEDATAKIAIGIKALADLKDLYIKTEATNGWPVEWQGQVGTKTG